MIGLQDVGAPWRSARSAKGAVLFRVPATHKLPVLAIDPERAVEFLGLFNSTTFDFLVRGLMSGHPWASSGCSPRWLCRHPTRTRVSPKPPSASRSHPTRWPASSGGTRTRRTPRSSYELDVLIDALVAHAYKPTQEQDDMVLDSFEVMAPQQTRRFGSCRFGADCLRGYDRIARGR